MKSLFVTTVLMAAFAASVFSSNYEEVMTANIQKMNASKTSAELTGLANQFERIANAETGKWQPRYYAAYCFVWATAINEMSSAEKHKLLDLAQAHLDVLLKSFKNESEIHALQAFTYLLRITDISKGFKYSGLANESLDEAEKLNPHNPRVFYLRGTNVYNTPKAFGGGREKAKPLFEKAAALFAGNQKAGKIDPVWGSGHNTQMLTLCRSNEN